MTALVVVCGLVAEAKIAKGADKLDVVAGGGDAAHIRGRLEQLAPRAVLSFGVAGGLSPKLRPGDARIAKAVIGPEGKSCPTDDAWSAALASALQVPRVVFAGVDAPLGDASAKIDLHRTTGADLVDMESHVVGEWAARHGARYAALRVVTDPAVRSLPHAATVGMRADGKVDLVAIVASLVGNPRQVPDLVRTGLDARAAFAALLRCRQRLGPTFALVDLGEALLDMA